MRIVDGTGSDRAVGVDVLNRLTIGSISTSIVHHQLHEGELFTCNYENTVTNTNEMTVIAFNTPLDRNIHMAFRAEVTGLAYLLFYENTSIDVGEGTTLTIYNRNRQKKRMTSMLLTIEATPAKGSVTRFDETQAANANITTSTELWSVQIGSDLKQSISAEVGQSANEWILESNQQYAVMVKSATDDDNVCNLTLNWQEEDIGGHGHAHY